ncbi:ParA family protein [Mammaliicoccus sciuri]|uniref:ParA family protein n=1 Tax=Mammaliicoccus sciuri TaxID=1296 RepID=UPI00194F5107|nr:ParA family protein [Mammaliicoccus sciuri]
MAIKYTISTNKGGEGKSTSVTNIASEIAKEGYKTAIIGMDAQGNESLSFGYRPDDFKDTIYDVLMGEAEAEDVIYKVSDNLYILPANDDMDYFTMDILQEYGTAEGILHVLKNRLESIEDQFDYIFVDAPPSMEIVQINILNYIDKIIVPYHPSVYSMRSIQRFINRVEKIQKSSNLNLNIEGILVTMYRENTNLHKTNLLDLYKFAQQRKINVFEEKIPHTIKLGEAPFMYRQPAVLVDEFKNLDAVKNYKTIAKKIIELDHK